MTALDTLIPQPRLAEIDRIELAVAPEVVWQRVRHGALGDSAITRVLFAIRTAVGRRRRDARTAGVLRVDGLTSSPERPGFQVLADDPPREVAVGAIGQVWRLDIPFVHVPDAGSYAAFAAPGFVKVAWAMRVSKRAGTGAHLEIEVRVDATDESAWRRFRRYFRFIGPASRFIRRSMLRGLAREFGTPGAGPREAALFPGAGGTR
jgi:hypothetical protein